MVITEINVSILKLNKKEIFTKLDGNLDTLIKKTKDRTKYINITIESRVYFLHLCMYYYSNIFINLLRMKKEKKKRKFMHIMLYKHTISS